MLKLLNFGFCFMLFVNSAAVLLLFYVKLFVFFSQIKMLMFVCLRNSKKQSFNCFVRHSVAEPISLTVGSRSLLAPGLKSFIEIFEIFFILTSRAPRTGNFVFPWLANKQLCTRRNPDVRHGSLVQFCINLKLKSSARQEWRKKLQN